MGLLLRSITVVLAFVLLAASKPAPDLSGTWQGTLQAPTGRVPRLMRISKQPRGYDVRIYSVQESYVPIRTHDVRIDGSAITMAFAMNSDPWLDYHRSYHAKLSGDGTALRGTWNIPGVFSAPMIFHRSAPVTLHLLEPKRDVYVQVAHGVKDEVLDWGGHGRPMVLLAGQGATARIWSAVIPHLAARYHVYSITRRGFGNSTRPAATAQNYRPARLGSDVLAVLAALRIRRPILVGHSIGGEELSYIGTYAPRKASALIYLDAAYEESYDAHIRVPTPPTPPPGAATPTPIDRAIDDNPEHFTAQIHEPILAIFANPHDDRPGPGESAADIAAYDAFTTKQIAAFKRGQPTAHVLVIPGANHFVYMSNTAEVLRAIDAFTAGLPM